MAFSADEVRVLRRALAQALHPAVPAVHLQLSDRPLYADAGAALWAEDVQDALRLTEAIDEAVREGAGCAPSSSPTSPATGPPCPAAPAATWNGWRRR